MIIAMIIMITMMIMTITMMILIIISNSSCRLNSFTFLSSFQLKLRIMVITTMTMKQWNNENNKNEYWQRRSSPPQIQIDSDDINVTMMMIDDENHHHHDDDNDDNVIMMMKIIIIILSSLPCPTPKASNASVTIPSKLNSRVLSQSTEKVNWKSRLTKSTEKNQLQGQKAYQLKLKVICVNSPKLLLIPKYWKILKVRLLNLLFSNSPKAFTSLRLSSSSPLSICTITNLPVSLRWPENLIW